MEIVLLWLDELDDLAFSAALAWRSACRLGLTLGLPAALLLTPIYETQLREHWNITLSIVAAGSVLAWLSAAVPLLRRPLPPTSPA